jgi:hypothetical protein
MSVAFVLTCLLGQAQPVIGLSCGQEFATQEECQTSEQQSLGNGIATPLHSGEMRGSSRPKTARVVCTPRYERVEAGKLTLIEDGTAEILAYSEPSSAGLNGHLYIGQSSSRRDLLLQAKILMDSRAGHYWEPEIRIFRNRVFWRCNSPEDQPAASAIPQ